MSDCRHPPERLFAWYARDDSVRRKRKDYGAGDRTVFCVACCECGTILRGGVYEDYSEMPDLMDEEKPKRKRQGG